MDNYDKILEYYEYSQEEVYEKESEAFNDFIKSYNFCYLKNLKYLYYFYFQKMPTFSILKYKFPNYFDKYIKLLEKYGYNIEEEVRDAITSLGLLENPNKNLEMINYLLNYSDIEDISFNGKDQFDIYSNNFGEISFILAKEKFKNNKKMINYLENNELPNQCHNHTYFMSKIFPDNYAITSLVLGLFNNMRYYHSYGYNKNEDTVIDLNANAIIDSKIYNMLYKPEVLVNLPNTEVDEVLKKVNEITSQRKDKYEMLKIALYQQSLEEKNKILIKS